MLLRLETVEENRGGIKDMLEDERMMAVTQTEMRGEEGLRCSASRAVGAAPGPDPETLGQGLAH